MADLQAAHALWAAQHRGRALTHGHSTYKRPSPTYRSWCDMIKRCVNQNATNYKYYGGRGIHVCERWTAFENFFADMGEKPASMSLERINNDRDYEPGNCRWATLIDQVRNRRIARRLTYLGGITLTQAQWAELFHIRYGTLQSRLARGWSLERSLNQPLR